MDLHLNPDELRAVRALPAPLPYFQGHRGRELFTSRPDRAHARGTKRRRPSQF